MHILTYGGAVRRDQEETMTPATPNPQLNPSSLSDLRLDVNALGNC